MKSFLTLLTLTLSGCQPSFADRDQSNDSGQGDSGSDSERARSVYINEFMASNGSVLFEGIPEKETPDWIELYNATDVPINLAGFTITDDLEEPDRHVLSNLGIEPRSYLVLFADGDPEEGPEHLDFKLDVDGESIGLYSPEGLALDRVEYTHMMTDMVAARMPDGGSLAGTYESTPGTTNPSEVSE